MAGEQEFKQMQFEQLLTGLLNPDNDLRSQAEVWNDSFVHFSYF